MLGKVRLSCVSPFESQVESLEWLLIPAVAVSLSNLIFALDSASFGRDHHGTLAQVERPGAARQGQGLPIPALPLPTGQLVVWRAVADPRSAAVTSDRAGH